MPTVHTFLAWKKGDEKDDCQDSIHPLPSDPADNSCAFAVSDGATTSFFSRVWAQILTSQFAENHEEALSNWDGWLQVAQEKWKAKVGEIANSGSANFFVVNGFHSKKPAGATFAGLVLYEKNENGWPWRAQVLGDSCIFILGAEGSPRVIDLKTSAEFSNLVKAAESWPRNDSHLPSAHGSQPDDNETQIQEHDVVLIASDALSKWMLLRAESERPVWGSVFELAEEQKFQEFVAQARSEADNPLENDDVALAVLKFGDPHPRYQQDRFEPMPAPPPVPVEKRDKEARPLATVREAERAHARGKLDRAIPIGAAMLLKRRWGAWGFTALIVLSLVTLFVVRRYADTLNRAHDQISYFQNKMKRLSFGRDTASAQVTKLQKELDAMQSASYESEKSIARLTGEKAEQAKELKATRARYEQKLTTVTTEVSKLKSENAGLKNRLAELSSDSNRLEPPVSK